MKNKHRFSFNIKSSIDKSISIYPTRIVKNIFNFKFCCSYNEMRIKVVAYTMHRGCAIRILKMLYFFLKTWQPNHRIYLLPWQPCLKIYCVYLDRENKDNENDTEPYTKARILTDKLYIICIIKQEKNQFKRVGISLYQK